MKENKFIKKAKEIFGSVSAEERISGKMIALLIVILISFLMIVICLITLIQKNKNGGNDTVDITATVEKSTDNKQTDAAKETGVSEYFISDAQINPSDYEMQIEAETLERPSNLNVSSSRPGFSGESFVWGFSAEDKKVLQFVFDVPTDQHYDISICFASDTVVRNEIYMNDEFLFDFSCKPDSTGRFVIKTYYGVFMEKGKNILTVHQVDGGFDLDYIKVQNNKSIYAAKTDIEPTLINASASDTAKELMKYLTDNFGKKVITGQYVSSSENTEIQKIYDNTAKYPAIRFGDMRGYSTNLPESEKNKTGDEIETAIKWAEDGGIVGYVWHWYSPIYAAEIYSDKTDFDLSYAVTVNDVAVMNDEDLEHYRSVGAITNECYALIKDIDAISLQLQRLNEKNIPVLWRPIHEASGDWFWWGKSGPDAYKWLWTVMYRRMTEYHHLNNLIWIWSAQGKEYFVGNNLFDIASVDLYDPNTDNTSYYKQYQWLYSLTEGQKLIALSECGTLPDMELTFRDRAVWSFFGLWYGDYILDKNGELSEKYNTRESLMIMYNSNRSITLDKYRKRNEKEPVTTTITSSNEETHTSKQPDNIITSNPGPDVVQ